MGVEGVEGGGRARTGEHFAKAVLPGHVVRDSKQRAEDDGRAGAHALDAMLCAPFVDQDLTVGLSLA